MLLVGGAIVAYTWPENYGESSAKGTNSELFTNAFSLIYRGERGAGRKGGR